MIERKALLLFAALAAMAVVSVPTVLFQKAASKYFGFLGNWSAGAIKPSRTGAIPAMHPREPRRADMPQPELRFVRFSARIKNAKDVFLAADFNKWDPAAIRLAKKDRDYWETIVPLPPGQYKYFFFVDGQETLDPLNPETAQAEGKKVSLLTVK